MHGLVERKLQEHIQYCEGHIVELGIHMLTESDELLVARIDKMIETLRYSIELATEGLACLEKAIQAREESDALLKRMNFVLRSADMMGRDKVKVIFSSLEHQINVQEQNVRHNSKLFLKYAEVIELSE